VPAVPLRNVAVSFVGMLCFVMDCLPLTAYFTTVERRALQIEKQLHAL
jgi:hypothetical protein